MEEKLHNKGQINYYKALLLIILFFAAMNFQAKFFYLVYTGFILTCINNKRIRVNRTCLLYLFLGIIMSLYNVTDGILGKIRRFAFLANYIVGFNFITNGNNNIDNDESFNTIVSLSLIVSAFGAYAHYMMNFISNSGSVIGRNTIDVWSGEIMSSTGQATLASLIIGVCCAWFVKPPKKLYRVIAIAITISVLLYNLILSGRTIIVMCVITLLISILYIVRNEENINRKIYVIIWAILAIILFSLLYSFNIFNIQNIFMSSNLYARFGGYTDNILDTSRNERKLLYIQNMYRYLFGGLHLREQFGYAHDLLLDAYDEFGFITFILLCVILFKSIKNVLRFMKIDVILPQTKVLTLCIYTIIILEFFVEPIFAGMPWFFACFCLFNGVISATIELDSRLKELFSSGLHLVNDANRENGWM